MPEDNLKYVVAFYSVFMHWIVALVVGFLYWCLTTLILCLISMPFDLLLRWLHLTPFDINVSSGVLTVMNVVTPVLWFMNTTSVVVSVIWNIVTVAIAGVCSLFVHENKRPRNN